VGGYMRAIPRYTAIVGGARRRSTPVPHTATGEHGNHCVC
jgi:hypothetical protein